MDLLSIERRSEIILGVQLDAPVRARTFVHNRLAVLGYPHLIENGTLIASELVTNVVKHAKGTRFLTLGICNNRGKPLIEVTDASLQVPKVIYDPFGESGRGMLLVDELSTMWGCHVKTTGKTVWALLL